MRSTMHGGLDVPAETRPRQHLGDERRKAAERSFDHRLGWLGRMQIDRRAERFGGLQHRPEKFVVEIATALMAVDHRTGEGLIADAAFELFGRLIRCRNRQRGEAGESCWLLGDCFGQRVIGVARECHRLSGFQLLDPRRGQRDDLDVDAGGIHLGDPLFADVAQVAHKPLGAAAALARLFLEVAARAIEKARRSEMLFKRDGAHGLDAPLPPDITPKPGFPRKIPMLEANGGDFPNDPKLCPMIGSAPTYAARHSSRRVPTIGRSRCRLGPSRHLLRLHKGGRYRSEADIGEDL
jgi:hypothetical protein